MCRGNHGIVRRGGRGGLGSRRRARGQKLPRPTEINDHEAVQPRDAVACGVAPAVLSTAFDLRGRVGAGHLHPRGELETEFAISVRSGELHRLEFEAGVVGYPHLPR